MQISWTKNSKLQTFSSFKPGKACRIIRLSSYLHWSVGTWRKNATLESIEKIAGALNVPISKLVEQIGKSSDAATDIPLECYHFLCKKTYKEQEALYQLLLNADAYKSL